MSTEQKKQEKNDLKYVFRTFAGIPFRFRVWLAGKIIPKRLSDFGRAWAMGIPVSLEPAPNPAEGKVELVKPNRAMRRARKA